MKRVFISAVLLVVFCMYPIAAFGISNASGSFPGALVSAYIEKGEKSEEVKEVQERLIHLGYLKGSADGDFGNGTEKAIVLFQGFNGFDNDGELSYNQYKYLMDSNAPQYQKKFTDDFFKADMRFEYEDDGKSWRWAGSGLRYDAKKLLVKDDERLESGTILMNLLFTSDHALLLMIDIISKDYFEADVIAVRVEDSMFGFFPDADYTFYDSDENYFVETVFYPIGKDGLKMLSAIANAHNNSDDNLIEIATLDGDERIACTLDGKSIESQVAIDIAIFTDLFIKSGGYTLDYDSIDEEWPIETKD